MKKLTYQELEKKVKELEANNSKIKNTDKVYQDRQLFLSILDEIPAFIYLQAKDYTIRYSNKYFNEQFGKPLRKSLCHKLLWDRNKPCEVCPTFKVFDTQSPQIWEWNDEINDQIYQIYDYPFKDIDGSPLVLELGINITKRKKAEKSLQEAHVEIKTLRGILPICSSCKKIRDDTGYWNQIENYIHDHSEAHFTHGICPDCTKKLYPDLDLGSFD